MDLLNRTNGSAAKMGSANDPLAKFYAFQHLQKAHTLWQGASDALSSVIHAPVCVEHCGFCCKTNLPISHDIEADYVLSQTLALKLKLESLRSRLEGWITEFPTGITAKTGEPCPPEQQLAEGQRLQATGCPLLDGDDRCLLHEARPMVCRSYGVTVPPGLECKRPLGPMEPVGRRIWVGVGPGTKAMMEVVERVQDAAGSIRFGFFPTLLYSKLAPDRFRELYNLGQIPLVKASVGFRRNSWRLFMIPAPAPGQRAGLVPGSISQGGPPNV